MAWHGIAWHCIALHCIAWHCIALHGVALRCIASHCIALHCIALLCIAWHCIAIHQSPVSSRCHVRSSPRRAHPFIRCSCGGSFIRGWFVVVRTPHPDAPRDLAIPLSRSLSHCFTFPLGHRLEIYAVPVRPGRCRVLFTSPLAGVKLLGRFALPTWLQVRRYSANVMYCNVLYCTVLYCTVLFRAHVAAGASPRTRMLECTVPVSSSSG